MTTFTGTRCSRCCVRKERKQRGVLGALERRVFMHEPSQGTHSLPCAMPPLSVRVAEVVLVECQRGEGELRRSVLQIFHPNGDLLAEHDRIHEDPVYASYFLRDAPANLCAKGPHEG
ncbi:hypothetical protein ASD05_25800 [Variovorax sp. Root434]|nr:hypothetical protein ASD05_25800 [Variovorax sp. Root434]